MLTQQRLKHLLIYDKKTGLFYWKNPNSKKIKKGSVAGSIKKGEKNRVVICVDKKMYKAHRLAFLYVTGSFPPQEVDHIDHNMQNNKWDNLRLASRAENFKNLPMNKNNTSGVTGVHFANNINKWVAFINYNGKRRHLGSFDTAEEAVSMRLTALDSFDFHFNHGLL